MSLNAALFFHNFNNLKYSGGTINHLVAFHRVHTKKHELNCDCPSTTANGITSVHHICPQRINKTLEGGSIWSAFGDIFKKHPSLSSDQVEAYQGALTGTKKHYEEAVARGDNAGASKELNGLQAFYHRNKDASKLMNFNPQLDDNFNIDTASSGHIKEYAANDVEEYSRSHPHMPTGMGIDDRIPEHRTLYEDDDDDDDRLPTHHHEAPIPTHHDEHHNEEEEWHDAHEPDEHQPPKKPTPAPEDAPQSKKAKPTVNGIPTNDDDQILAIVANHPHATPNYPTDFSHYSSYIRTRTQLHGILDHTTKFANQILGGGISFHTEYHPYDPWKPVGELASGLADSALGAISM